MTPEYKARNVTASIREHGYDVNDAATWLTYGRQGNLEQQALVRQALAGK
jgi:hypothetical protein